MATIPILKSELAALEQKVKDQEKIIRDQQEIIKLQAQLLEKMRDLMVLAGILPVKQPETESAGS